MSSMTGGGGGRSESDILQDASLLDHHHHYYCLCGEQDDQILPAADVGSISSCKDQDEAHGVRMIALLMDCAVAISLGNLSDANLMLLELSQTASPYSPSCAERLVAYFTEAMATRLLNSWVGISSSCSRPLPLPYATIHAAFRAFYNIAPFARLAYLACNEAILQAFHGKHRVHIVDLDIVPGGALQWLSLLPALAARQGGPPVLARLTGFGMSSSVLRDTGNQLAGLATKLGMPFEFYAVAKRPGDAHVVARPGEAVAVHWLRHAVYDAAGDEKATMRLVQLLEPKVVTLVEPERGGGHFFPERFVSALQHYSAVFDSLGASASSSSSSRHLAEHVVLGREIGNVLAVEFGNGSWRAELARHGFVQQPGDVDGTGMLKVGWKGMPLYAVSIWH